MTDLKAALDRVLATHADPFGTDARVEDIDTVTAEAIAAGESWQETSPHRRRAREQADKEAAR